MRVVTERIDNNELAEMSRNFFGNFVKAVVDIEKGIMAIDGELHADEESLLIESGSAQKDLWGINIYPEIEGSDRIEFDSMINLKPVLGNRSRSIENPSVREKIVNIVNKLVKK